MTRTPVPCSSVSARTVTDRPALSSWLSRAAAPAPTRWGRHGPTEHRGTPRAVHVGDDHVALRRDGEPARTPRRATPARKRSHRPTAPTPTGTDQEHDMSARMETIKRLAESDPYWRGYLDGMTAAHHDNSAAHEYARLSQARIDRNAGTTDYDSEWTRRASNARDEWGGYALCGR